MISLNAYWTDVATRANRKGNAERYGQAAFNYLAEVRPDLSERVRGTYLDPFYASSVADNRFINFMGFLRENW